MNQPNLQFIIYKAYIYFNLFIFLLLLRTLLLMSEQMIFEERILKISTLLKNLSLEILMNFINKKHTLPNQNILQTFALELQNQTHTIELCNTTFVLNICKSVLELYSSQHFILELYSSSHFILELYSSTPVLDQFQSSAIWTKLNTTWQFAHNQGRESFSFLTLKYTSLLIHFFLLLFRIFILHILFCLDNFLWTRKM